MPLSLPAIALPSRSPRGTADEGIQHVGRTPLADTGDVLRRGQRGYGVAVFLGGVDGELAGEPPGRVELRDVVGSLGGVQVDRRSPGDDDDVQVGLHAPGE